MGKQVSFDLFAGLFYGLAKLLQEYFSPEVLQWLVSVSSAFFASIVACLSSQPGDMILTSTYGTSSSHGGAHSSSSVKGKKDFSSIVSQIYKQHGVGGFYLGTQVHPLNLHTQTCKNTHSLYY